MTESKPDGDIIYQRHKEQNLEIKEIQGKIDSIGKKDKLALTISSLALLISLISAVIGSITNYRDAYYRELLIKPSLEFYYSNSPNEFSIRNTGVGAAIIKRISFRDYYGCIDTRYMSSRMAFLDKFYENIDYDFQKEAGYNLMNKHGRKFRLLKTSTKKNIANGSIIAPGQTYGIIEVDLKFVENSDVDNRELNIDLENISSNSFSAIMKYRSFKIEYCSLSEKTCESLESGTNPRHCYDKPPNRDVSR